MALTIITITTVIIILLLVKFFGKKKTNTESFDIEISKSYERAGLPLLKLSFGGVVGHFLFDTGASTCVISSEMLKFSDYETKEGSVKLTTAGGETSGGRIISQLSYDGRYLGEYEFVILDEAIVTIRKNMGIELDGIVGRPFMERNKAKICYDKLKINLNA